MTTSEAARRAARLDREGRARFDAFADRVAARSVELGLRGAELRRYQDVALLVYRAANRRRRGAATGFRYRTTYVLGDGVEREDSAHTRPGPALHRADRLRLELADHVSRAVLVRDDGDPERGSLSWEDACPMPDCGVEWPEELSRCPGCGTTTADAEAAWATIAAGTP